MRAPVPDYNTAEGVSAPMTVRRAGALVLGGDYRALGVARSLGRRGIPVWLVTDDHWLAAASRYVSRRFRSPDGGEIAQLQFLERLAEDEGASGWMIVPTTDGAAELLSRHHRRLAEHYLVSVPPWQTLRWAHDKRMTYSLADMVGVDYPWTLTPANEGELRRAAGHFPVILKPAFKPARNSFTDDKAWRVNDEAALVVAYRSACELIPPSAVLVQEFVRGDGSAQFSYAALAVDGRPVASLCARRLRQWPRTIGRTSTYVETVESPAVERAAERLLEAMRFTGLVEIEFKKDAADGRLKLLDINPRVWGWHSIGRRAGVDFSYLLWRFVHGEAVEPVRARAGTRWMRLATDLPMAFVELLKGRLGATEYVRSLFGPVEGAVFAADDPLPGLCELPMIGALVLRRHRI
ncbi:MAG TPA: ATP-grasp domain-containing protein [Candidatus Limnocylindria bacterium]|nr:ATP-grasp domain-containing protein [Candidatus Limnocylindria bacterium]